MPRRIHPGNPGGTRREKGNLMYIFDIVNMNGLRSLIAEKRAEAVMVAKEQGVWIRSRGTYLTTSDGHGQCDPRPAAECPDWKGTKKEIDELIALCMRDYPEVKMILIEGGYDSADTFEDLWRNDNYAPQSSWWDEVVWKK
jgi:hypothetical protein